MNTNKENKNKGNLFTLKNALKATAVVTLTQSARNLDQSNNSNNNAIEKMSNDIAALNNEAYSNYQTPVNINGIGFGQQNTYRANQVSKEFQAFLEEQRNKQPRNSIIKEKRVKKKEKSKANKKARNMQVLNDGGEEALRSSYQNMTAKQRIIQASKDCLSGDPQTPWGLYNLMNPGNPLTPQTLACEFFRHIKRFGANQAFEDLKDILEALGESTQLSNFNTSNTASIPPLIRVYQQFMGVALTFIPDLTGLITEIENSTLTLPGSNDQLRRYALIERTDLNFPQYVDDYIRCINLELKNAGLLYYNADNCQNIFTGPDENEIPGGDGENGDGEDDHEIPGDDGEIGGDDGEKDDNIDELDTNDTEERSEEKAGGQNEKPKDDNTWYYVGGGIGGGIASIGGLSYLGREGWKAYQRKKQVHNEKPKLHTIQEEDEMDEEDDGEKTKKPSNKSLRNKKDIESQNNSFRSNDSKTKRPDQNNKEESRLNDQEEQFTKNGKNFNDAENQMIDNKSSINHKPIKAEQPKPQIQNNTAQKNKFNNGFEEDSWTKVGRNNKPERQNPGTQNKELDNNVQNEKFEPNQQKQPETKEMQTKKQNQFDNSIKKPSPQHGGGSPKNQSLKRDDSGNREFQQNDNQKSKESPKNHVQQKDQLNVQQQKQVSDKKVSDVLTNNQKPVSSNNNVYDINNNNTYQQRQNNDLYKNQAQIQQDKSTLLQDAGKNSLNQKQPQKQTSNQFQKQQVEKQTSNNRFSALGN